MLKIEPNEDTNEVKKLNKKFRMILQLHMLTVL